jgi:hypothetical protein
VKKLLKELPRGVELVAAAKTRTAEEILEAIDAGIKIIGENYLQEAERVFKIIGRRVKWHFIGHLQRNKVKKALEIFDLIETVDSFRLAEEINKRASQQGKIVEVLVEVNSGREEQKFGVLPEEVEEFIKEISSFPNMKVMGLMTLGRLSASPEETRSEFRETRQIFEKIKKSSLPNVEMKYLSMGTSNTYRIAFEEGANLVRVGTKIFGPRPTKTK